jgi:replicative DNA helicase
MIAMKKKNHGWTRMDTDKEINFRHGAGLKPKKESETAMLTKNDCLMTGFEELDATTGGLRPGGCYVLAGKPSVGKTAFAMRIAHHLLKEGEPVGWVNLDMNHHQWMSRLVCLECGGSLPKLAMGASRMDEGERQDRDEAITRMKEFPLAFTQDESLYRILEFIQYQRVHHDMRFVVIDYLQHVHHDAAGVLTPQKIWKHSLEMIHLLCAQLGVTALVLSQVNRWGAAPYLEEAEGNFEIWLLDEMWRPEDPKEKRSMLLTRRLKNESPDVQSGPVGSSHEFWFHQRLMTFGEWGGVEGGAE